MRLPPALAASATPALLAQLPPAPARVLELDFAGIHAEPFRLAGYEVVVVERDPAHLERARQRGGEVLAEIPAAAFDAVVAPQGAEHPTAPRVLLVRQDGSVWSSASS